MKSSQRRRSRNRLYRTFDSLSGFLIVLSIVFAPWAFGTVHTLSIWILNGIGYTLGILLLLKFLLSKHGTVRVDHHLLTGSGRGLLLTSKVIAAVSTLVLAFILVHALNYRAVFDQQTLNLSINEDSISLIPHSYDRAKTWALFFQYLALYCHFWAAFFWILIVPQRKSEENYSENALQTFKNDDRLSLMFPSRLRRILIILVINGVLLAMVGILQKISASPKLLWIYEPQFNKFAIQHFGPFAYRGNAASYLNLLWPIALGAIAFEFQNARRRRQSRAGTGPQILFIPALFVLLISPLMTSSRAALCVFFLLALLLIACICKASDKRNRPKFLFFIVMAAGVIATTIWFLQGDQLSSRVAKTLRSGPLPKDDSRIDIYQHFPEMISDQPFWGYGPGTFSTIYLLNRKPALNVVHARPSSLHRNDRMVEWIPWAHSDPIEFLLTFGWLGLGLLLLPLLLVEFQTLKCFFAHDTRQLIWVMGFARYGLYAHCLVDFPFQIYSILHLFALSIVISLTSLLSTSQRRSG